MKKLLFTLLLCCSAMVFAQEQKSKAQVKMEELQAQKQTITQLEKDKLKEKVASINDRLEAQTITVEEAEELKKKAAEQHAMNIENQYDLIDLNIDLIKRNQNDTLAKNTYIDVGAILTDTKRMSAVDSIPRVIFAGSYIGLGTSSVLDQTQKAYKDIGLQMSIGVRFTTVFSRKSPEYRLNYGVEFSLNNLAIKDNKLFSDEPNSAQLVEVPQNLDRSSFNLGNLIFPIHLEYGKTKIDYSGSRAPYDLTSGNRATYDLYSDWNYGIGGFLGAKMVSSQNFKYEDEGEDVSKSIQRPYNTENFLYGLSAYAGYGPIKLNVRYHLNSIFQNSNANGNVLSVGVLIGY